MIEGLVPHRKGAPARTVAKFANSRDGATAIEFGLVALPFIALIFAVLETAIIFFAGEMFESAVDAAARQIRTGQAQTRPDPDDASRTSPMTEAEFKSEICENIPVLFDCEAGVQVDVRTYDSFAEAKVSRPPVVDGELKTDDFTYQPGGSGAIVLVRAIYAWPVIVNLMGFNPGDLPNGKRLMVATKAFRNEPFGS